MDPGLEHRRGEGGSAQWGQSFPQECCVSLLLCERPSPPLPVMGYPPLHRSARSLSDSTHYTTGRPWPAWLRLAEPEQPPEDWLPGRQWLARFGRAGARADAAANDLKTKAAASSLASAHGRNMGYAEARASVLPRLPAAWCDRWAVERRPPMPRTAPPGALLRRHLSALSIGLCEATAARWQAALGARPIPRECVARLVVLEEPLPHVPQTISRWIRNHARALRLLAWEPSAMHLDLPLLRTLRETLLDELATWDGEATSALNPLADAATDVSEHPSRDAPAEAARDAAAQRVMQAAAQEADPLRQSYMLLSGLLTAWSAVRQDTGLDNAFARQNDLSLALMIANLPLVRANLHPLLSVETGAAQALRSSQYQFMSLHEASCERFDALYQTPWRRDPYRSRHLPARLRMTHAWLESGQPPNLNALMVLAPPCMSAGQRMRLARSVLGDMTVWLEEGSARGLSRRGASLALAFGVSEERVLCWRAAAMQATGFP